MSLTVREAADVQRLLRWLAALHSWEYAQDLSDLEPAVAESVLRLADASHARLLNTGQGYGITSQHLHETDFVRSLIDGS